MNRHQLGSKFGELIVREILKFREITGQWNGHFAWFWGTCSWPYKDGSTSYVQVSV